MDTVFAVWQCHSDMLVARRVNGLQNNSKRYGPLLHTQPFMMYRQGDVSLFNTAIITAAVIEKTRHVVSTKRGQSDRDANLHKPVIVMSTFLSRLHHH